VLVQVITQAGRFSADETFEELESLTDTAGALIVGRVRQQKNRPDPRRYVGKGKLEELRCLCGEAEADVVICDDELKPSVVRALEAELDVKVVDRTEVILDIFASHARTREAMLQVELAQLEYQFPRLKSMWTHLDRTAGGTMGGPVGGGIGVRGPGERQLEMDRRLVERRIYELKKDLEKIQHDRQIVVQGRSDQFTAVALVGYTNAGKSSLMNALTGAGVSVRDRLFETLDTRTRRWEVADGRRALLSDTVGFIRKFPHHLAASFRATLEEARDADLLLHVIDAAKDDSEQEVQAVNAVLEEIGCTSKPTLYLLNKIDRVVDGSQVPLLEKVLGDVICTSALTGEGLDLLRERVAAFIDGRKTALRVEASVADGKLLAFLHANGQVLEQSTEGEHLRLTVRISPAFLGAIRRMGGQVCQEPAG
jgi:GTP-binding protein HflX